MQSRTALIRSEGEGNAITEANDDWPVVNESLRDTTRPLILAYLALNGTMSYFDLEVEVRKLAKSLLTAGQVQRDILALYNASLVTFEGHLECKLTSAGAELGAPLAELVNR